MKGVSIKDVATRCGASVSTVSIVINGKGRQRKISHGTIAKVLEAVEQLGYVPNSLARGLRTGRTNTIGLVVDDISNFFFGHLAKAIELEVEKAGYALMFCNSKNDEGRVVDVLSQLIDKQMDGYIIAPTTNMRESILQLKENNIPFVLIDRYFPDIESNHVIIDNYQAAFEGTSHLIERGYKKIGIVIKKTDQIQLNERYRGYKSALSRQGAELCESIEYFIPERHSDAMVKKGLRKFLKVHPELDSILFTSNSLGILGMDCIRELNLKIGKDIGVVCFDDNDTFRLMSPAVTVVAQPIENMGKTAVENVMFQLGHKKELRSGKKVLKPKLLVRDSTPQRI